MPEQIHQSKNEDSSKRTNGATNASENPLAIDQLSPVGSSFANGLNPRQNAVLRMQQTHGNAAVMRMLAKRGGTSRQSVQREDDPGSQDQDGTPTAIDYDPRSWPTALSTTKRGKGEHITKVEGKPELNVPDMPANNLDDTQK